MTLLTQKTSTVIFDLDGVLIHTDEQHYEAWKALCDRLGIQFDRERNHLFRGVSRMACMDLLERWNSAPFTEAQKAGYANWKNERYRALLENLSKASVAPDTFDTLAQLRRRGYQLAIGSSSKNARFILERTGLMPYFDAVADGTQIVNSKPDPEVFLLAASQLAVNSAECIVVEDAASGLAAAKAANMITVGIGEAAKLPQADFCILELKEILDILKGLR
ncbi:MAG: beta-phosphoglucomutase [Clostridiaceae bacterium]